MPLPDGSRTRNIISIARVKLNDVSKLKINDFDLYRELNNLIRNIYNLFHGFERIFEITLAINKYEYDISPYGKIVHKKIIPEWGGGINFILATEIFDLLSYNKSGTPYTASIYNDKLLLFPIPDAVKKIKLYALQLMPLTEVTASIDPEYPERYDDLVALGLAAVFDESFMPAYLQKLDLYEIEYHRKTLEPYIIECRW